MDETKSKGDSSVLVAGSIAGAFVAGFIAIAVFHQGSGWLLNMIGVYPPRYKTQPIPPFGVPQILSQCFWGGVWGIVLAWTLAHWPKVNYWLLAFAFGLIVPTLGRRNWSGSRARRSHWPGERVRRAAPTVIREVQEAARAKRVQLPILKAGPFRRSIHGAKSPR